MALSPPARAEEPAADEILSAVVKVKAFINPDGRTAENLGREREGSGVVIDKNGLILTIGYLMVEAHAAAITTNDGHSVPASIVGYDNESGFGLLRAMLPLKARPVVLGYSGALKPNDKALAVSFGGRDHALPVRIAARRDFAGGWEYLLENAIFTTPPHPFWSGAALIDRHGKLVGIGSLIVTDVTGNGTGAAGNMFVPIDRLAPILGDLMTDGRVQAPPRPWLGMTTGEIAGHLVVRNVTPDGPAQKAGVHSGDLVTGVNGKAANNLADLYRKIWALGSAGTVVPLDIIRNSETRRIDVPSMNRLDHLRLNSTF
jgi:S1-C subfamily serine protease